MEQSEERNSVHFSGEEYSLFSDVGDKELQATNRAKTMANIIEIHGGIRLGKVKPYTARVLIEYFHAIPEQERAATKEQLTVIIGGHL